MENIIKYYENHRTFLELRKEKLQKISAKLILVRIVLIILMTVGILSRFFIEFSMSFYIWVFPLTMLAVALVFDIIITKRIKTLEIPLLWYKNALLRIEGDWRGRGIIHVPDISDHPYAADADIFGSGSLMDLLCRARTIRGTETLGSWLSTCANSTEISRRQQAIAELAGLDTFIESLVNLEELKSCDRTEAVLDSYSSKSSVFTLKTGIYYSAAAIFCSLALIGSFVGWAADLWPIIVPALAFVPVIILQILTMGRVSAVNSTLKSAASETSSLDEIIQILTKNTFKSEMMTEIKKTLCESKDSAGNIIGTLRTLTTLAESSNNQIWAFFAFILFQNLHIAVYAERFRMRFGKTIRLWTVRTGEIEALFSLAVFKRENSDSIFPEVEDEAIISVKDCRNPLFLPSRWQTADLILDKNMRIAIVSGSNMSGKSSLLRTLALNYALAGAGCCVTASSFRFKPGNLVCSIRVLDSTWHGISRFYAEVRKLKTVTENARKGEFVFFLIDELFSGTNSEDRVQGARRLTQNLLKSDTLGIMTTHDLAITALESEFPGNILNFHYSDHVVDGELVFDYRMRSGRIQTSNAVLILEKEGII